MKQSVFVAAAVVLALTFSRAASAQPAASTYAAATANAAADIKPKPEAPALDAEYRLGPGDKLRVEVYKDPQLSQSVQIRPDGKITLPLLGDIDATGRTPLELRDSLATALKEYITNPVVTVIVVEALASRVFVMGEVTKAGPVEIHGPTTVLQALAMAGGFKEFANTKDVKVLRQTAKGVETIKFNYREASRGGGTPIYLRPGDTVIVP
jgi:polysaccharide biosynthesis/export protein